MLTYANHAEAEKISLISAFGAPVKKEWNKRIQGLTATFIGSEFAKIKCFRSHFLIFVCEISTLPCWTVMPAQWRKRNSQKRDTKTIQLCLKIYGHTKGPATEMSSVFHPNGTPVLSERIGKGDAVCQFFKAYVQSAQNEEEEIERWNVFSALQTADVLLRGADLLCELWLADLLFFSDFSQIFAEFFHDHIVKESSRRFDHCVELFPKIKENC